MVVGQCKGVVARGKSVECGQGPTRAAAGHEVPISDLSCDIV